MQSGRHLSRCVLQPPAHTTVSSDMRPSCSGLPPVTVWKTPRMESAQFPLGNQCHCPTVLRQPGENLPPYIQSELLLLQLMPIVSHLPILHCCEAPGSIYLKTSPQALRAAVRFPLKAISALGWTSPSPSASLRFSSSLITFHWNCFNLLMFFLN